MVWQRVAVRADSKTLFRRVAIGTPVVQSYDLLSELVSQETTMLLHIEPGKPDPKQLQDLDATMEPLVAAAAAGRPLVPAMESITRSFGFDTFVYGVTTVPHPLRDSRCW